MIGKTEQLQRYRALKISGISEDTICRIWKYQLVNKEKLFAYDPAGFQIVYPGRWNRAAGPDFRDALVAMQDGTLLHGDVEVDLRASDWIAHKHHLNSAYNNVILHIVLVQDTDKPTLLQANKVVPVLPLWNFTDEGWGDLIQRCTTLSCIEDPCRPEEVLPNSMNALTILEAQGERRFLEKALAYEQALACVSPDQVLYEGLADALGYSNNREPFILLARSLPYAVLKGMIAGKSDQKACSIAQALLFGTAGLLPSQSSGGGSLPSNRESELPSDLVRIWRKSGFDACLKASAWRFSGLRPGNDPVRRIAGLASLVTRLPEGLTGFLLDKVRSPDSPQVCSEIRKVMQVEMRTGEIKSGLPGVVAGWGAGKSLIGRSRAADIVLNVVLPFAYGYGELVSDMALMSNAKHAYANHPRLCENWVTRYVSAKVFGSNRPVFPLRASHQQGMLGLYYRYCRDRHCHSCPVLTAGAA